MGDADDELERAAKRRRRRVAAATKAVPSEADVAAERERSRRRMNRIRVEEALAEAGWAGKLGSIVALCIGMFGPMTVALFVWDVERIGPLVVTSLACMAGAFVAYRIYERAFAALRRRRVLAVGHGFDASGYLAALGENRRHATVVVRAAFARPWSADKRASARDAVLEWLPELATVEWEGERLVMRSAEVTGTEWLDGDRFFNNKAIHGCFDVIARRVVPRLHAVSPITKLEVDLVGQVEDFDAEP